VLRYFKIPCALLDRKVSRLSAIAKSGTNVKLKISLVITFGLLCSVSTLCNAQAYDAATIKQEIVLLWSNYTNAFMQGQAGKIANEFYDPPVYIINNEDVTSITTVPGIESWFETGMSNQKELGYKRTETKTLKVCVMSQSSVILNTEFIRYRDDDSILSEGAGTYVIVLKQEGWRIVSMILHSANQALQCVE
jgi:hypothetical protein